MIPIEVLFGNPSKSFATVSPNGKKIAYVAPHEGVANVWVGEVEGGAFEPVTQDRKQGIRSYRWAHDAKHLLFVQDEEGDENWHLHAVDLERKKTTDLTPFGEIYAQIIGTDKRHPSEVLVAINRDDPALHDVFRLNIESGELILVAKNPGNVSAMQPDQPAWFGDRDLKVLGCIAARDDAGYDLLIRESEDDDWVVLKTWDFEDSRNTRPLGFTADGKAFHAIDSSGTNAGRLVRFNISTREVDVIAEDPVYDAELVLLNPDTKEVQAVGFDRARLEWSVIDESLRSDFEAIRSLQEGDFYFLGRDDEDRMWCVAFAVSDGPVTYYLFDRSTKKGRVLFEDRPELRNYQLAPMEPFSFESRDGLIIHGYISFPPGSSRENLPMVLHPHGGPWARDIWAFYPDVQFIASRGYICLNVNFRGSTGYGKEFLNAGNREWAGKMHDDLIDAVNWAVGQGYADPKKVAILGGSYGGYAALVGATFTPEVFCCIVDLFGWSDLVTALKIVPPYWKPRLAQWYRRVGNPETEAEFLWSRSPLSRVDQIRSPMLIAQGANDVRVPKIASDQIAEALEKRGIQYEYIVFPDEGHGFVKPENRFKFYRAAERFLAKHLGS